MEVLLLARDVKYMNNKWKVKFPKIYKEKLQMVDIGGIGNITYKKVVYPNYEYVLTDEGAIIRPTESEPVINLQEDYGIRVSTMHRIKGLEFQYIFVVACNNRVVLLTSAITNQDPIAKEESIISKRCLLYVSLTRAQKKAYITSYGKQSEFLD